MARTAITAQSQPGFNGTSALLVTMNAADATNYNSVKYSGHILIIAQNTDTVSHNITFTSKADTLGRTGDITQAIAAGAIYTFPVVSTEGWLQSDGNLYFQADNALVKFGVLLLPF